MARYRKIDPRLWADAPPTVQALAHSRRELADA